jgi:hypothetical protein
MRASSLSSGGLRPPDLSERDRRSYLPAAGRERRYRKSVNVTRRWFKPWGWIYLPVSVMGWLAVLVTVAFCINTSLAIDRHSHSVSDTLYGIFPFWVPALLVLNWLASKTSRTT